MRQSLKRIEGSCGKAEPFRTGRRQGRLPWEAVAVFTGDDEGLDRFRLLEVVEMVQLAQPSGS